MEKYHNRSWWIKLWLIIGAIGAILISSILVVFFFFIIDSSTPTLFLKTNLLNVKIVEKNVASIKVDVPIDQQIIDSESDPNADKLQNNFLLGKKGLEVMKMKMNDRLGFGPEFFALKEVIFMEGQENSLIDQSARGVYYPATQQIIINTTQWVNYFRNNWQERLNYFDDISEMLFQVLYHEYGHHKANTYLLNVYQNDNVTLTSQDIYHEAFLEREIEPWNKYFVDNFKNYLTYNDDKALYEDIDIECLNSDQEFEPCKVDLTYNYQTKKNLNIKSIGSIYNAKTLFERANGQAAPQYQEVIDKFNNQNPSAIAFSPRHTFFKPLTLLDPIDLDTLSYYYCLQELFTRKYMQLTFPFKKTTILNDQGFVLSSLKNAQSFFASPYLDDTLKYQLYLDNNDKMRFLSDAPLQNSTVADGLINTFHNLNGQNTTANLSLIWQNNTSEIVEENNIAKINVADKKQAKQIKFGGFLTPDQMSKNYQYIGYFDDDLNQNFKAIKIEKFQYKFNRVDKLGINKTLPLESGSTNFYVTNQWTDGENINGKTLFFANDDVGKNIEPLSSLLQADQNKAIATSNRFYQPIGFNDFYLFFQGELENNNVMIKQYQR